MVCNENEAMELASFIGLSSKDVKELDIVARLYHCAKSSIKYSTSLTSEECLLVVSWLVKERKSNG